jgi:hypothetical protein
MISSIYNHADSFFFSSILLRLGYKMNIKTNKKRKIENNNTHLTMVHDNDNISSAQYSFIYVKNLLVLSISNIAYYRGLLTPECYTDCLFEGIPFKILKLAEKKQDY